MRLQSELCRTLALATFLHRAMFTRSCWRASSCESCESSRITLLLSGCSMHHAGGRCFTSAFQSRQRHVSLPFAPDRSRRCCYTRTFGGAVVPRLARLWIRGSGIIRGSSWRRGDRLTKCFLTAPEVRYGCTGVHQPMSSQVLPRRPPLLLHGATRTGTAPTCRERQHLTRGRLRRRFARLSARGLSGSIQGASFTAITGKGISPSLGLGRARHVLRVVHGSMGLASAWRNVPSWRIGR